MADTKTNGPWGIVDEESPSSAKGLLKRVVKVVTEVPSDDESIDDVGDEQHKRTVNVSHNTPMHTGTVDKHHSVRANHVETSRGARHGDERRQFNVAHDSRLDRQSLELAAQQHQSAAVGDERPPSPQRIPFGQRYYNELVEHSSDDNDAPSAIASGLTRRTVINVVREQSGAAPDCATSTRLAPPAASSSKGYRTRSGRPGVSVRVDSDDEHCEPRHEALAYENSRHGRLAPMHVAVSLVFFIGVALLVGLTTTKSRMIWYDFDHDTVATTFSNVMVMPQAYSPIQYLNSEQTPSNYVRYGHYTEYVTSSFDFLHHRSSPIEVPKYGAADESTGKVQFSVLGTSSVDNMARRRKRSLDDELAETPDDSPVLSSVRDDDSYTVGESHYIAAFHQRLMNHSKIGPGYMNLASIDTISKSNFTSRVPKIHGKLSFSTYENDTMREVLTIDAHNTHVRSSNVFFNRNLYVGDDIYFKVHHEHGRHGHHLKERSVYLPLLSVSADYRNESNDRARTDEAADDSNDVDVHGYVNNRYTVRVSSARHANTRGSASNEFTLNVGSADAQHVNVLTGHSMVIGAYNRSYSPAAAHQNFDFYETAAVYTASNVYHGVPVASVHQQCKLATDARLATNIVRLSSNEKARRRALEFVTSLQVAKYDVLEASALHDNRTRAIERRGKVSVLAQEIQATLPDAVIDTTIDIPRVEQRASSSSPSTDATVAAQRRPSDFRVVLERVQAKTVDTDTLLMYMVMAMQEQQQRIERLEEQLAKRDQR